MKAITYDQYGSPDIIRLREIEKPTPGDYQVRIKTRAVSINSWDWDMLTGKPFEYRLLSGLFKPKSPLLHGCDIAGQVEAIGKGVTQFHVGDDVFCDLSENGWGAFTEYCCAFEEYLTHIPAGITYTEAACLPHAGNLAVQGLIGYGGIQTGQKVLINGGGGSTGVLAIQIAKLFDVEITAVDHTVKLDFMRTLGADHVVDFTKENFTQSDRKYDLIFDVKTSRSYFDYCRVLNTGGTYVTVGGLSYRILQSVFFGKLSRKYRMQMVAYKANQDSAYLADLVGSGKLKPVIDRCYPLKETAEAFRYFGKGMFKGKIVITSGYD